MVVVAGVTAVVAAAATPAAAISARRVGALPFPRSADAAEGGFPNLCSLQCNLLGEPAPVLSAYGTAVAVSPTMCADHLHTTVWKDGLPAGWVEYTDHPDNICWRHFLRISDIVDKLGNPRGGGLGADVRYVPFREQLSVPCAGAGARTAAVGATTPRAALPEWLSLLGGGADGDTRQRLVAEADIVRELTLQRNTFFGAVERVVNRFSVLGVTGATLGVCGSSRCWHTWALDNTRRSRHVSGDCPGGGTAPCYYSSMPILTLNGTDGVERPVSVGERNLLSLGRGLLANARWLGAHAPTYNLHGQVWLEGMEKTTHAWYLNGSGVVRGDWDSPLRTRIPADAPSATPWLAQVATVLCSGDSTDFVLDPRLCDGVERREDLGTPTSSGLQPALRVTWRVAHTASDDDALLLPYEREVWTANQSAIDPAFKGPMPQVVATRGRRELNPGSPDEAALAASLFQRQLLMPIRPSGTINGTELRSGLAWQPWLDRRTLHEDLAAMSSTYRADVFRVEEPEEPVTTASLVLAVTVVLPELVVVAAFATRRGPWSRRAFAAAVVWSAMGAVAVAGIAALAVSEAAGAAWRATATRTALACAFPPGAGVSPDGFVNRTGTVVEEWRTLLVVARVGYRPRLLAVTAAVVGAVYVAVVGAVLVRGLCVSYRRGGAPAAPTGAAEEGTGGGGEPWEPWRVHAEEEGGKEPAGSRGSLTAGRRRGDAEVAGGGLPPPQPGADAATSIGCRHRPSAGPDTWASGVGQGGP